MDDSDSARVAPRSPPAQRNQRTGGEVLEIDEHRPEAEHVSAERAAARQPTAAEVKLVDQPLPAAVRTTLEDLVRSGRTEHRSVLRARIVLLAATGMASRAIAREVRCAPGTVTKWRRRFAEEGLPGLADAPRWGKVKTYNAPEQAPPRPNRSSAAR